MYRGPPKSTELSKHYRLSSVGNTLQQTESEVQSIPVPGNSHPRRELEQKIQYVLKNTIAIYMRSALMQCQV